MTTAQLTTGPLARWAVSVPAVIKQHAPLLAVTLGYTAGVAVLHLATGQWAHWYIFLLPPRIVHLALAVSALVLGIEAMARAGRVDLGPRRVLSAILVLALAAPFQSSFHAFKQTFNVLRPFTWDGTLAGLDRALHLGRHPWEWLWPLVRSDAAVRVFDWAYFAWLPLVFGFMVWLAWTTDRSIRLRALVTLALLWVVLGSGLAWLLPSAGPCFVHDQIPAAGYGGLLGTLHAHHGVRPLIAVDVQYWLHHAFSTGVRMPFGGITAMPSLHVAVAVLMALVMWRVHPAAGAAAAVYATVIQTGSVVLGWHYAIDGYVSAALTPLLWAAVGRLGHEGEIGAERRVA